MGPVYNHLEKPDIFDKSVNAFESIIFIKCDNRLILNNNIVQLQAVASSLLSPQSSKPLQMAVFGMQFWFKHLYWFIIHGASNGIIKLNYCTDFIGPRITNFISNVNSFTHRILPV